MNGAVGIEIFRRPFPFKWTRFFFAGLGSAFAVCVLANYETFGASRFVIILGVDPGTLVTGYGVIDSTPGGSRMSVIEYGTIESKRISSLPLRLEAIFLGLQEVIERSVPDEFAIESAFYHKNVQSTLKLGHARGVAILAAVLKQLPTAEYAPREIKRAVVGNGNGSKDQVEYMVRTMLNLKTEDKKLPDAYDALAVAITHAGRSGLSGQKAWKNWKQFAAENPGRVKL